MEPMFPDDPSRELDYLSESLLSKTSALSKALHPTTREAIASFLRPMNSYYSNLIEGHDTHPLDIEAALNGKYSDIKANRSLQLEAKAHINLHASICELFKNGSKNAYDANFLTFLHSEFYKHLPDDFKIAKRTDGSSIKIIPGKFRNCEVQVGQHIAPHSAHLESFLKRFESYYNPESNTNNSKTRRIISIAASHHRLAWIHPFIDGNGRVVRLFSDACFMSEELHASGLWSMSRGLARKETEYKTSLALADAPRWNDHDGRGNLSNKELVHFCKYFLTTAIDQVEFMTKVLDVDNMLNRIHKFVDLMVSKGKLKDESRYVLEAAFLKGKVPKKEVERLTGKSDKTAKNIAESLIEINLLKVDPNNRFSPYEVNYPIKFSTILLSGLYPNSKELDFLKEF